MSRILSVLLVVTYTFAAIAIPLGYALYLQPDTHPTLLIACPCGCDGDENKCSCHHRSNGPAFSPCGMGSQNVILPDAGVGLAVMETSGLNMSSPLQTFSFSSTIDHTLTGVADRVKHPPRLQS